MAASKSSKGRKYSKGASKKVGRALHERKQGTLESGRSKKKVKSKKQAIAIGLSEARKEGEKVPPKKTAKKSGGRKSAKKSGGKKTAKKSGTAGKSGGKKATSKKSGSKKSGSRKTSAKKGGKKSGSKKSAKSS